MKGDLETNQSRSYTVLQKTTNSSGEDAYANDRSPSLQIKYLDNDNKVKIDD